MKHLLHLTILLVLITIPAASPINLYFGPTNSKLDDEFISYLSKAKETIDAAFYELRDHRIKQALIDAHNNGVKVRFLVDSNNYYLMDHKTMQIDYDGRNEYVKELIEAGIPVKDDQRRSGLMHNKFCVIDSQFVWTGSFNITTTGSGRNENNALWLKSPELARIYTREFKEMFEDGQFGISSPSTIEDQTASFDDTKVSVYFAPEDDPMGKIRELLKSAEEEVYFMEFAFTDTDAGNILVDKHKSGVKVQGIFDKLLYRSTGPYAEFSRLTRAGIPVVVYDSPLMGKLHHKVFIIDPNGEHPKVITGSLNASTNGNKSNDENIMVIENKDIARRYTAQFKELFGKTSRVVASFRSLNDIYNSSVIPRLNLYINSNGVSAKKLRIQMPPRWPKQEAEELGIKIYRPSKGDWIDTTSQEKFYVSTTSLYISSANLEKSGENSMLMVRYHNLNTPEIPGLYNFYIQAKYSVGSFYPLKTQPVLNILDRESDTPYQEDSEEEVLQQLTSGDYNKINDLFLNKSRLLTNHQFVSKSLKIVQQHALMGEDVPEELLRSLRELQDELK
jgi:phosphatidylserine/phosphatidylglycerophosphate/cardiolipin synthase-like enzyme